MSRKEYRRWVKTISRIGNPLWHRFRRGLRLVRGISAQLPHSVSNGPTLIYCCLQDQLHGEALRAIANFMKKLGHPVNIDKKQPCCGALYERLIGGEEGIAYPTIRHRAVQLQQRSHKSFLNWLPANSFIVSRMCLGHIHENGGHASDLYQMINRILKDKDLTLYFPTPREVFYQPYCRRTEMNPDSILPLLRNIEGLTVREFSFPKSCCGGYCGESLLHPVESRQLAQAKIGELPPGSTVIVSGPDCWLALSSLQDSGLNIMDAIEILDQADIRNGTTEKSFEILH
jgi:Fe-S oxidoreductase